MLEMNVYERFVRVLERLFLVDEVDLDQPKPLDSESAYWRLVSARFFARYWECRMDPAITSRFDVIQFLRDQGVADGVDEPVEAIRTLCAQRKARIQDYLKASRVLTGGSYPAPRMIRLAERLDLKDDELDVLHYLVLVHSDSRFSDYQGRQDETGQIALFLGLDNQRYLKVFSKSSKLIEEDVIRMDSSIFSSMQSQDVLMDSPVVRALAGAELDKEDLMVVSGTIIEEILREEPGGDAVLDKVDHQGEEDCDDDQGLDTEDRQDGDALDEVMLDAALESELDELELPEAGLAFSDEPFTSELDYLNEHMEWFLARVNWKKLVLEGPNGLRSLDDKKSFSAKLREAQARERVAKASLDQRLAATLDQSDFMPRGEHLKQTRGLDDFEKHVLLFAAATAASMEFREKLETRRRGLDVGEVLYLLVDSLEEQIKARRYFYKDAALIRDGLINVSSGTFSGDLLEMDLELDRRMVDFLLGIETESVSLVEGSHLYTPRVNIDQVVLPDEQKRDIVDSVQYFPAYLAELKRSQLNEVVPYGGGMVLLFHGESGTGKTMLANALAAKLGKKVLLVNFPTIGEMTADESLKFLIREAKLHNAVLFFDECDGIFRDREGNPGISLLLTELERHDELVILATNRPFDLDEAMERRISRMVEFRLPDARYRERIWANHLPEGLRMSAQPDIPALAYKYELTGGLIKNAVLAAVSMATARDPDHPVIRPEDLEEGARRQMRGRLRVANLEDQFVPRIGLEDLVVPEKIQSLLEELIGVEKARATLVGQWGFAEDRDRGMGATAMLAGPPGTGKSMAAEAIAFELGRPVKRVNMAQVISKWVGEGSKNVELVFQSARQTNAVLVFDEADALFAARTNVASSTDRYANLEVAVLLREMERFPGVVILTTNLRDNVDEAFIRRLRFVLELDRPDQSARERLWRKLLPSRMPLAEDIDLVTLAEDFDLSGGQIRNAVVKAASRAALRQGSERCVSQQDLHDAAQTELAALNQPRTVGFI